MNNEQIKQLEKELWGAADDVLANSKLRKTKVKFYNIRIVEGLTEGCVFFE